MDVIDFSLKKILMCMKLFLFLKKLFHFFKEVNPINVQIYFTKSSMKIFSSDKKSKTQ